MKQKMIEAGLIRNTHALRGEVKVECWLDGEKPFSGVENLYLAQKKENPLRLVKCRRQGDIFLVQFQGIDTVEEASLLKGKTCYAAREDLDPKDEKIYFADLIGLPLVEQKSGRVYGTVKEVTSRGAGELLVIERENGAEQYFPMVKDWICRMDADEGIFVQAPEGLFD